jgi:hypothetical protein
MPLCLGTISRRRIEGAFTACERDGSDWFDSGSGDSRERVWTMCVWRHCKCWDIRVRIPAGVTQHPDRLWEPTHPLIQWVTKFCPGGKADGARFFGGTLDRHCHFISSHSNKAGSTTAKRARLTGKGSRSTTVLSH